MAFRFRKSFRIAPGLRINVSTSGLSTTLGTRGMNVTTGRRGTFLNAGIPGTGVSARGRLGGGGGSLAGGGDEGKAGGCGCVGAGVAGFFLLVLAGLCGDATTPDTPYAANPPAYLQSSSAYSGSDSEAAYTGSRDDFYVHGSMNVRSQPNKYAAVVRTLSRGDRVSLGPKDANGWAPLFDYAGRQTGFVYRASDLVRTQAPPTRYSATAGSSRRSSAESRGYYTGPRGGCYTYSSSGRKRYVDRSLCN
ncbi:MAG TPA: DUF4236 domain-containing protein [Longimicrobium sp.]|jgi:hypothetical protein|uniref:DUF4236 domain-containing protein n=1 Tax=Longimicrobium sp. TaxID=2029185 RepID=UPI002ED7F5A0